MTTDRADRQKLAQVIQSMWKAVNVGVNLQFLYGRGLFATCSAGGPLYCRTFDAAIYTWVGGDDPSFMGLYNCAGIPTKENNWVRPEQPRLVQQGCRQGPERRPRPTPTSPFPTTKRKPFIYDLLQGLDSRSAGHPAVRQLRADCLPHRLQELHLRPDPVCSLRLERLHWELSK